MNFKVFNSVDEEWNRHLLNCKYADFFQTREYVTFGENENKKPFFIYVFDEDGNVKGQLALNLLTSISVYSSDFLRRKINYFSDLGRRISWVNGPIIFENNNSERLKILKFFLKAIEQIANENSVTIIGGYSPHFFL